MPVVHNLFIIAGRPIFDNTTVARGGRRSFKPPSKLVLMHGPVPAHGPGGLGALTYADEPNLGTTSSGPKLIEFEILCETFILEESKTFILMRKWAWFLVIQCASISMAIEKPKSTNCIISPLSSSRSHIITFIQRKMQSMHSSISSVTSSSALAPLKWSLCKDFRLA